MTIEPFDASKLEAIVRLSLRAWEPVFESIRSALGPDVFREHYPEWRASQRNAVAAACTDESVRVWVATLQAQTVGFAALKLHHSERMGEIYMIAVDPDYQRRGIAAELTRHSLDWFRQAGMTTVMVETGGDDGHAPARRTYEAAGFRLFPVARYFRKL